MLTRVFLSFLCLLVAGVWGAPVDVSKEAGPFVQSKPQISVVRYSVSPDSNGIPKATKPRQRTREKQFYSPHPLPDLLRESQVMDHSTFGQKKRAATPTKAGKHSFYIVTPNVNVKRNVSPDQSSTSSSEGSSTVNTHSSVEVSTFLENHNTNAQSPSYALKQVSNRYEFPLSSSEDIFTDSGSLSTLGSLGLLSNDAAGGGHSGNSFGIPIPPINSDSQTFTAIPTDIAALNSLSSQDLTSLNNLSPQEITSLTKSLLDNLNIDSKDLNGLLNLDVTHLESSAASPTGISTDHTKSFGVLLPGLGSQVSTDSSSQSFGVPLPGGSSQSIDQSGQGQSFGVSLSEANSHGSVDNAGQSQKNGVSLSEANSHRSADNSGQSQSFGVSLSEANSHGSTDNSGQSQSFGVSLSEANSFGSPDNSGQGQSFGVSLSEANSHRSNDNSGQSQSFGVSLSEANSHGSPDNSGQGQSFGVSLSEANSHRSNDNSGQSQSFGVSLAEANSHGSPDNSGQGQSFGVSLSEANSHRSNDNSGQSQSFGVSLAEANSHGSPDNSGHDQSFGVSLSQANSHGSTDNSGQSQSVGVSLAEANSHLSSSSDKSGLSQSFGISLSDANSHSSSDNSGQSQSFGVPIPRQSHASSGNSDASQSHGIPLPSINQDTSSSSSFDVGQNSVTGNGDSISQASGQSHSFGIGLPGLSSSSPSDGLGQSKSVGIPLPGINPDDSGNNFHTPLTVVSEGSSQFSLNKNGNNAILSSSSSSKLSPVFIGGTDDSGENIVTVNVNANGGNTGIPLPGLGGASSPIDNLTIGQLLMGINGQNGIMVLPMSSLNDLKNGGTNGLTIVTDSSSEADEKVVVNLSSSATTTAAPETTTRRRRTTTTTKAPDTFRVTLSDLLYSKGQWLGTLLGGMFDYGRIAWNAVQDHLDATAQPVYGYPQPVYGSYASNPQPVYG